jgi:PKD repeat protein
MHSHQLRAAGVLLVILALVGCSGGSDDDGGGNAAPVASFTATPDTGEAPLTVSFDAGASSDSDGTVASYLWSFGDSSANGSGATTTHDYPGPGTYTVTLTVTDNDGATANTTRTVTVTDGPPPDTVTLSGQVTYDRVPFETSGDGLDYAGTEALPARGVVVQLLNSGGTALATTVTGDDGRYQFNAPASTSVRVRVRARLLRTSGGAGQPGWDVRVNDNTNGNAQYVLDGSLQSTGTTSQTRNLNADSGWAGFGGTTYTGVRAAAPFAMLDTIYEALRFVTTQGDPAQVFETLDVYWSPENRAVDGDDDFSDGQIGSTFFYFAEGAASPPGIYVLGDDGVDTDEYDTHVIAHEFMHFLEHSVSRSDSIGGPHFQGDKLDPRVAFSEGFGNAFSGMALDDSVYRDSNGASQSDGFSFDVEDNVWTNPGWYSEGSVASIVWDMFDTVDDGADSTTVPFSDMYHVQLNELRTTPALTSIFPFIAALKTRPAVDAAGIDAVVAAQSMVSSTIDAYATTETNDGGFGDEVLPMYTTLTLNGPAREVCGRADDIFFYNTIGNRRFLRFTLSSPTTAEIRVVASGAGLPLPDPDLILYQNGFLDFSECAGPDGGACTEPLNTEVLQRSLPEGDYVLEVYDYRMIDEAEGVRSSTCMNVSLTG